MHVVQNVGDFLSISRTPTQPSGQNIRVTANKLRLACGQSILKCYQDRYLYYILNNSKKMKVRENGCNYKINSFQNFHSKSEIKMKIHLPSIIFTCFLF